MSDLNPARNISEISKETIAKIRSLSREQFEPAFLAHLQTERKISMIIVYFMQEAYRRRTWAQNFPSFSSYCTEHLRMSDSDFYRKYSILKTIEELPEIEEKILIGQVSASTVAKMSHFFHRDSKSTGNLVPPERKREVFQQMQGLTLRQVERELAILSPQSAMPDKTRQITETAFVRQFTSNQQLENKITRAKQLLAHSLPQPPSDCQLFTKITDLALEKIDPILKQKRIDQRAVRAAKISMPSSDSLNEPIAKHNPSVSASPLASPSAAKSTSTSSHPNRTRDPISEKLKREVLQRDEYACTHVNHDTGKICGSQHAIEIDHVLPVAQGGESTLNNLRVLCRTHNQLRALETFGRKKMAEHLPRL